MPQTVVMDIGSATDTHIACFQSLQSYARKHELAWDVVFKNQKTTIPNDAVLILDHANENRRTKNQRLPVGTLFGNSTNWSARCLSFAEQQFGTLAAQHLARQGYRHCVLIETERMAASQTCQEKLRGFRQEAEALGLALSTYTHASEAAIPELINWLTAWDQPIGVYTTTDWQASWLRHILADAGVRLPGSIGILGTGNHINICITRQPALSSVSYPWQQMGTALGRWVQRLLQTGKAPEPEHLRPFQVIKRDSTPLAKHKDPLVGKAMKWLQNHLSSARPLIDLAKAMDCSQETLCRRFRSSIGRSPQKIHADFRMQHAEELLAQGKLSMAAISKRCGFANPTTFSATFKKHYHCTPSHWQRSLVEDH